MGLTGEREAGVQGGGGGGRGEDGGGFARRSARAGAAATLGQGASLVALLASAPVLGRLLSPEDYGLVGMVTAVSGFLYAVRELGLRRAAVQARSLSELQRSSLFWLGVAGAIASAGVVAALGPALAWFYGEAELAGLAAGVAIGFAVSGLGVQHTAMLQRELRFGAVAIVQGLAAVLGAAAGIAHAAVAPSPWALVTLQVVTALVLAAGPWACVRWRPSFPTARVRAAGIGALVRYGAWSSVSDLTAAVSRHADKVIVGRVFGDEALGAYARSFSLLVMPMRQVTMPLGSVALPTLSRLRDDPSRYRAFYRRGLSAASLATVPIAPFVASCAGPIVFTLLGDQWGAAVPIVVAMSPGILALATAPATVWVYQSLGHVDRQFRWMLLAAGVALAAFVVGATVSPAAVAGLAGGAALVLRVPGAWWCFRGTFVRMGDFWGAVWPAVAASLVAGGVAWGLEAAVVPGAWPEPVRLAALAPAFAAAYLAALGSFGAGRRSVRDAFEMARLVRRGAGEARGADADGGGS